uniref:DDE-1 domain-containing protein n=1 Tax=Trichuris muris TaxID=70415 RepID=A0A5S6QD63_TRIMR
MLGANASGDLKLKPLMIHRHANPRALRGIVKSSLGVYYRRTFKMLIDATDGENCETVMEFWKNYNLRMAINNIVEAWNDVSKRCLHRVWRKLIPDLICDFKDFEPSAQEWNIRILRTF